MTQLQDQMTALGNYLKSEHGVTEDQVNIIVSRATTPITTQISGILDSEKSDEDKLADIQAALGDLANATLPAPAPAPDSAPDSAPASAPSA